MFGVVRLSVKRQMAVFAVNSSPSLFTSAERFNLDANDGVKHTSAKFRYNRHLFAMKLHVGTMKVSVMLVYSVDV